MKIFPAIFASLLFAFTSHAQTPPGLPEKSDPIDLSNWADVLFFIVIPVLMVVVFLVMRKRPRHEE